MEHLRRHEHKNTTSYVYISNSVYVRSSLPDPHQIQIMGSAALMEQMAMYFAALPCPPLPIMACRENAAGEDRLDAHNSHDLLAEFLLHAMHLDNKQLNEKRKLFQQNVTRRLLDALNAQPEPGPERSYYLFQQFTADYIQAFAGQPQGKHNQHSFSASVSAL